MPWICVEWMNEWIRRDWTSTAGVSFQKSCCQCCSRWSPGVDPNSDPFHLGLKEMPPRHRVFCSSDSWLFLRASFPSVSGCLASSLGVDKEGGSTEHAGWTLSSVEGRPGLTSVAPWPSSALGEAVIPYPVDSSPEPRSDGHGSLLKILKSTSPCCSENVSLQDSESRMYLEPLFSLYGSSSGRQQGTGARWHATWKEIPKPLPLCRLTLCSTSWLSWCQKDTPQRCFSVSWAGFQLGRQVVVCLSLDLPRNTWFPPWQPNLPHVLLLLVN